MATAESVTDRVVVSASQPTASSRTGLCLFSRSLQEVLAAEGCLILENMLECV